MSSHSDRTEQYLSAQVQMDAVRAWRRPRPSRPLAAPPARRKPAGAPHPGRMRWLSRALAPRLVRRPEPG